MHKNMWWDVVLDKCVTATVCSWQPGVGCQGCWRWAGPWDPTISGASTCSLTATIMAGWSRTTAAAAPKEWGGRMISCSGCGSPAAPSTPRYICRLVRENCVAHKLFQTNLSYGNKFIFVLTRSFFSLKNIVHITGKCLRCHQKINTIYFI